MIHHYHAGKYMILSLETKILWINVVNSYITQIIILLPIVKNDYHS